jgi:hypothetical protein
VGQVVLSRANGADQAAWIHNNRQRAVGEAL